MPLYRRFPKRGFNNAQFQKDFAIVNVGTLEGAFEAGATVDRAALQAKGFIASSCEGLRVLGDGDLTRKFTVRADHFSKTAKEKIEKAGGTCDLIPPPKKPVRNKMKPRPVKKEK
jgi:large subunit ribosomal protein L15